jgi:ferric-dicitrate binding protein FerR (iron transport regulator)
MKIDRHTLNRYFAGESPEEEKENIRLWLENDRTHRNLFIRERIRFDATLVADEYTVDVAGKNRSALRRNKTEKLLKIAAAVILIIGSSHFYSAYRIRQTARAMQYAYVPPGSRTSLTLAEGSDVWLNSNTTLKYPGVFAGERVVELNGEGFFDIARDHGKPFVIHTDKYSLEVLGTSFNLESYAGSQTFEIALFTGRVKLYTNRTDGSGDTLYLNAGQTGALVDGQIVVSATNFDKYRWKEGLIVIEDCSFEEVMRLFEKYFDLQIFIHSDRVRKLGYRGKFRVVDGIDHALRVLQNDCRFSYRREETSNIIYID